MRRRSWSIAANCTAYGTPLSTKPFSKPGAGIAPGSSPGGDSSSICGGGVCTGGWKSPSPPPRRRRHERGQCRWGGTLRTQLDHARPAAGCSTACNRVSRAAQHTLSSMAVTKAPHTPNTTRCDIFGIPVAVGGFEGEGKAASLLRKLTKRREREKMKERKKIEVTKPS